MVQIGSQAEQPLRIEQKCRPLCLDTFPHKEVQKKCSNSVFPFNHQEKYLLGKRGKNKGGQEHFEKKKRTMHNVLIEKAINNNVGKVF